MNGSVRPALRLAVAAAAYRFRESLFLLPALIVVGSIVLAEVAAAVDRDAGPVPFTVTMHSSTATWLLSTVAGATITTAGVVFSLTVVSLQLASSQFSPRVMRSFIRDRLSQVVIGSLIATFVYCVLILRGIDGEAGSVAPRVSLTIAIALTVVTVLLIVAHLDHLAHGLQVGEVVRSIGGEGEQVLAAEAAVSRTEQRAATRYPPVGVPVLTVAAPRDGWVTQAPGDRVLAAVEPGATVCLETRTGAYIHAGEPLATVWPVPPSPERTRRRLIRTVLIADSRTMQNDIDFALRQLVDIGLRALSAAINDPTTAVEVVLRIGSLLRRLLTTDLPAEGVSGAEGRLLLRPWRLSPQEYVAHGFDQLRQAAPAQPQVAAALFRVLNMLMVHVRQSGREDVVPALRRQIDLLLDALRSTPGLHDADLERLATIATGTADPADHSKLSDETASRPAHQ
ncbi:DUF2254 domain-containing protein [Couchioplanes caeruleus]|uniref:DUF2254 domain-containing protein n=1 Tax=Couchioplanes caeruleus TaxID=56438 RepID=UPI0020BE08F1|nr:DUF2254 domain-containing protein [Couchioplanes caeruleus]UQU67609.1 DUF2254 domain-containing protein [Couchioplanes caeruleus]